MKLKLNDNTKFWIKTGLLYGLIALVFSLTSFMFIESCDWCGDKQTPEFDNDLIMHMIGHALFGMIVALPIWKIRYIIASGIFVVTMDFDHALKYIIGFVEDNILFTDIGFDIISRTGHSILFGVIVAIVIMYVYGKKDYFLGAISVAAVFGHMAFDVFSNSGVFPLFMPISDEMFYFSQESWVIIMIVGLGITSITKIVIYRKEQFEKQLT